MSKEPLIPPSPSEEDYRDTAHDEPGDLFARDNPLALFADWLAMADKKEPNDPNAMCLATVDETGMPDARMVLLKDFDEAGFVFYTNTHSAKGVELAANPKAALVFHWKSIRRQVRVRGHVSPVSTAEADEYFASRARDSRIGAWASKQSQELESRFALEKRVAKKAAEFGLGKVPRPPFWSGYRLAPIQIEFWRDRPFRLHDRLVFLRENLSAPWTQKRLYP
ncbi:MAG: pyridoxamine 5'-phosphate oxidase [Robiginitomaculum sp.]|nr:pyridoxamine 5'-phosphate oxidase [Robiginitomaculum sp.]MDQ7076723.1 pyridoxamine 5'-phosphate oxidase [Robiginitomaculum sp.]